MSPLTHLPADEAVTAGHFNALVDLVRNYLNLTAAAPLQAIRHSDGVHLSLSAQPSLVLVELDEHIEKDQLDKTGNLLDLYVDATSDPWKDAEIDITQVCDGEQSVYLKGERHLCWFHADAGKYLPAPGVHWHLAKLDADLSGSGSVDATLWHVSSGSEAATSGPLKVSVHGWLLDGRTLKSGTRVAVFQHRQSRRWYASPLPVQMASIEFTLDSGLSTSEASAAATVVAFWGGADPDPEEGGVTVYNMATKVTGVYHWEGDSGAHGYAVWDDVLSHYRIIDLECP